MLAVRDNLAECLSALRANKMRALLAMLDLTMGVATLISVMTIVQGASVYVEQKIANLGINVFQMARTPFAVTDFNVIVKALKYRKIEMDDVRAVEEKCDLCEEVGASGSFNNVRVRYGDKEATDVSLLGQTPNMTDIDTRTIESGRYFTPAEAEHRTNVCLIGSSLAEQLFPSGHPVGKPRRIGSAQVTVVGGIVMMNVMLVSVTARRSEIGVRRAVGATKMDVLRQFVAESVIQCLVGGVIGIALGFLVALCLRTFTPFPAAVQTWVAVLGMFMSSAVGMFFGFYPAFRASLFFAQLAMMS